MLVFGLVFINTNNFRSSVSNLFEATENKDISQTVGPLTKPTSPRDGCGRGVPTVNEMPKEGRGKPEASPRYAADPLTTPYDKNQKILTLNYSNDFVRKKCNIARCPEQFSILGVRTSPPTHRQPTTRRRYASVVPGVDRSCVALALSVRTESRRFALLMRGREGSHVIWRVLRARRTVTWFVQHWKKIDTCSSITPSIAERSGPCAKKWLHHVARKKLVLNLNFNRSLPSLSHLLDSLHWISTGVVHRSPLILHPPPHHLR